MDEVNTVEIFLKDLTEEAQKRYLEAAGDTEMNGNYKDVPIIEFVFDSEDSLDI